MNNPKIKRNLAHFGIGCQIVLGLLAPLDLERSFNQAMHVYYTTVYSTGHLYLAELNEGNEVGLGVGFTGHKGPGSLCVTVNFTV